MMATENETDGLMQQSQGNYWTEIDRLRAHVAAKVQENEEFRSEYGELEVKLENCEAELTNARLERDNIASLNSSLIAKLAEAKARIAELEAERAFHIEAYNAMLARAALAPSPADK